MAKLWVSLLLVAGVLLTVAAMVGSCDPSVYPC